MVGDNPLRRHRLHVVFVLMRLKQGLARAAEAWAITIINVANSFPQWDSGIHPLYPQQIQPPSHLHWFHGQTLLYSPTHTLLWGFSGSNSIGVFWMCLLKILTGAQTNGEILVLIKVREQIHCRGWISYDIERSFGAKICPPKLSL